VVNDSKADIASSSRVQDAGHKIPAYLYLKSSTVLTTNLGIASWGQIFDDPMVAAAMLDRLLHRSVVFNIEGESYRMRSHRARSEQLRKVVTQPLTK